MRILIAGRRASSSGVRTYTDALAAGLAGRGHQVFLLDETDGTDPLPSGGVRRVEAPAGGRRPREAVRRIAEELAVDAVHATYLDLAPRFARAVVTAWDPLVSPLARYRAAGKRAERPRREAR